MTDVPVLTLIIPVYRNEGSIPDLLDAVDGLHTHIDGAMQTVFVVDGSPDRSFELLRDALPGRRFPSQLVLLSRNFGSFSAIRAGLERSESDRYAVMAADLQEPPELVLEMDRVLRDEPVDVVVGTRDDRHDPALTRWPAALFWWCYRRYVVPEVPPGGVDVFACNRPFRDQLLRMDERHSSLIAQLFWLGFRRKSVGYTRRPRTHGASAWTLRKKINYLMDSVFSFTDLPIRLLVRVGGTTAMLAGMLGVIVAVCRLAGLIAVPGYAMTLLAIVFLGAVNLFGLGIVGSYAWRIYENTKGRPHTVAMQVLAFDGRAQP